MAALTLILALVHAALVASVPARDATLAVAPPGLRLEFNEPIEAPLARVSLARDHGPVTILAPRGDPRDVRTVLAALPPLGAGRYRVLWRVVSADGHPVAGEFAFTVTRGAPGAEQHPAPAGQAVPPVATSGTGPTVPGAAVRWIALTVLLALAGVLAVSSGAQDRVSFALAAGALPLLTADALLWARDAGAVMPALIDTTTGRLLVMRLGLVLLTAWALGLARRARLAIGFAVAAVLVTGAVGHPAAVRPLVAVPATMIHLLAVAVWLGGLVALVFGANARRVSRIALAAVAAVVLTGAIDTALLLGAPADLVRTSYGRLLLAKAAGLALLLAFGFRHRYRLIPNLEAGSAPALRRSVVYEIAVMTVVILTAVWLASVSPPSLSALPE